MRQLLVLGAFLTLGPAVDAIAQQPADPAHGQPPQQQAAPEPPPGTKTLNQCRACHTINEGGRTLIGPNLYGIFGRKTASVEGYRYSAAMRQYGETGNVWSEATLRPYLSNPKEVVPQTAMAFPGIPDEQQLNELIALLRKVTGGS